MMHKPIQIKDLSLSFPHKTCFDHFNAQIHYGNRIAIIGSNGSGKSTLLKILMGTFASATGDVFIPKDVTFGHVPQIITDFDALSGGQRLHKALTQALSADPNVLLLDEPTNHLDRNNRQSLLRLLRHYSGTLIVVSHDTELLRNNVDTLWHITNGKIEVFSGNYDDYKREIEAKRVSIEQELSRLHRQKKDTHQALMKEQNRAAKSRAKGEKSIAEHKWPLGGKASARRAEQTSGRKKVAIDDKKQALGERLSELRLPEVIVPKFSLQANDMGDRTILSITDGSVRYLDAVYLLKEIHLALRSQDRIAILGDNASGKSTLIKAILEDATVIKSGHWLMPKKVDIGYLDQHYNTLSIDKSVCETISACVPTWSHAEIRCHLNDFLFRKNEEVNMRVEQLSGGEKVRLCLAHIAALTPKMLILDEITNNLDLETKTHVIEVLKEYPGAMIVISHDEVFLKEIGIEEGYEIVDKTLKKC
jgi:ATPase subunit of ABC transporter with duplicated ATPase domains